MQRDQFRRWSDITSQISYEIPESEYNRIMHINVKPLYVSAKVIQPCFEKQKHGVFVNISSISAPRPRPKVVWYAGSKGAVSAITKGLAAEFAPSGVRVNAICPVVADTGMLPSVLGGVDTPEGREILTKGIPLGRVGTPRDVANAAAFLASDEADFITGRSNGSNSENVSRFLVPALILTVAQASNCPWMVEER